MEGGLGESQGTMPWPWAHKRHIPYMAHPYQLRQTQATASSTGIQAWETWHRARGPWGVATVARVQATVQTIQHFLLGTCLLVICLFTAEGRGRWVSRTLLGYS